MDSGAALTTSSLACGTGGSKASEEELDLEVPFYFVSTWFTVTDGGRMSSGSHQVPVAKMDCAGGLQLGFSDRCAHTWPCTPVEVATSTVRAYQNTLEPESIQ